MALSPEKLPNHSNKSSLGRYNPLSASTTNIGGNDTLGYKSLPSSIHHGLSEKILHNLSDKLEKLLPSGSANQRGHSGGHSELKVQKLGSIVDQDETMQRNRSGSLGITLSPSHNDTGKNVISPTAHHVDVVERIRDSPKPSSPEKYSKTSPSHVPAKQDVSSVTNGKGNR